MSWRKDVLPLACVLVLFGIIHMVESCTVGSNFNYQSCGACNFNCLSVQHTIASCTNGLCDCAAGWANCDQDNTNGCETRIPSNLVGFRCYGTGRNGKLDVQPGGRLLGIYNTYVTGSSGSTQLLHYGNPAGILQGDLVIIHQTQRYSPIGAWEYNRVVGFLPSYFLLEVPMMHDYNAFGAQIVAVAEFTDAVVGSGHLFGTYWNGFYGGILPMLVSGTLTVTNGYSIIMDGRGFRGQSAGNCHTCTDGIPGEGHTGIISSPSRGNVGNGGGGGAKGRDCGNGASGGYGDYGTSVGSPSAVCSDTSGGSAIGGSVVGGSNLRQQIHLGGAGGEGGSDEDGAYPGGGGDGGGIIIINAKGIVLGGGSEITSDGTRGGDGVQQASCGGSGCGMAGGGGGAGGGIRLVTNSLSGGGFVSAIGGGGGACSCSGLAGAPSGSYGRIEAGPGSISMGFNPGFNLPS